MTTEYEEIAGRIRAEGQPYHGDQLKTTAGCSDIVCAVCGALPADLHDWTSDWIHLCHAAMEHARETGHEVAVTSWHGAIYGPP
jgi:hypothetical protein